MTRILAFNYLACIGICRCLESNEVRHVRGVTSTPEVISSSLLLMTNFVHHPLVLINLLFDFLVLNFIVVCTVN